MWASDTGDKIVAGLVATDDPPLTIAEWRALQPGDTLVARIRSGMLVPGDTYTVEETQQVGHFAAVHVCGAYGYYAASFSRTAPAFCSELLTAFGGAQ